MSTSILLLLESYLTFIKMRLFTLLTLLLFTFELSAQNASFTTSGNAGCPGDCFQFTDQSTGTNISSWNWDFGGGAPADTNQNPNVCFNTAGVYSVTLTITDDNGTDDTVMTNLITIDPCSINADFTTEAVICLGNSIPSCKDFIDASTGTNITSWSWTFSGATPNSSTDQNPTNICFSTPGIHEIKLVVSDGVSTDSLIRTVTAVLPPVVQAGPDQAIQEGTSTVIAATGSGGIYSWTPPGTLSCSNCLESTATPLLSTMYTITITDIFNCSSSDSMLITVIPVEGGGIGVPTAFSPNNDGSNDELFVYGSGMEKMKFQVYNRYGQKVFETTDQTIGWDGKLNGSEMNPGIFTWVLEFNYFGKETEILKGNTTLIK